MIQAAIFDMDGLLIDSEPLWQTAEIAVFGELGLRLTREDCMKTMGLRIDEVVQHWHGVHPWQGPADDEVVARIVTEVGRLVQEQGQPMPGVDNALTFVRERGCKVGLATSSRRVLLDIVLDKLGIRRHFDEVYSAEHEPYGKPHPGVYLTTAARLGVPPTACVAFEDSLHGVIAAKAARMACVAVPYAGLKDTRKFAVADVILPSLLHLDDAAWAQLPG